MSGSQCSIALSTEKRIFRVEERTGDAIQRALNEAAAAAAVSNEEELKL